MLRSLHKIGFHDTRPHSTRQRHGLPPSRRIRNYPGLASVHGRVTSAKAPQCLRGLRLNFDRRLA